MKKTKILWAAALVIALVAMLVACPADEGLSLPGAAGDLGKVNAFDKPAPTNEDDAYQLLSYGLGALNVIGGYPYSGNLNDQAFEKAFKRQENMSYISWSVSNLGQKSYSKSVTFKDVDSAFTPDTYNGIKITGSSKGSWSSNRTYGDYSAWAVGDNASYSSSFNKKVDFNNTKLTYSSFWAGSYDVYGILSVQGSKSSKQKLTALGTATDTAKYDSSSSTTTKVSAVLSISDGTNSAKFKISTASESSDKNKQATSGGGSISSDIEVYSNDGKTKLFTIKDSVSIPVYGFYDFPAGF